MYTPLYRTLRLFWPGGMETRQHLQRLEDSQWLSKDEFRAMQLRKLQVIVKHAYDNVSFYHDLYKANDIHPNDIKSFADFQALPCITKQDIRANIEACIDRTVSKSSLDANHTGGSTGEPLHFFVSSSFWWSNAANEFRARRWHGFEEGSKMAWLWGDQRDVPNWNWKRRLRAKLMNQRFLNAFNMSQATMQDFADMLVLWQPVLIKGYATTLTLFAQFLKQKNINTIRPRFIESTAEKLWQPQRELIEDVFQCKIANSYSSREMGMMAYQCEQGRQHSLDDLRYIEIISKGNVVNQPDHLGAVAVTSFDHTAMPFIRYKNDDMAIYSDEQCPCGRSLSVLKEIVGRTNDYLVTSQGQFVHSEFFAYLLRTKPEVFRYQIHQPSRDYLNVKIVCTQALSEVWINDIQQKIQDRFGQSTQVTLDIVDDIPLTPAGKLRYIISDVEPEF